MSLALRHGPLAFARDFTVSKYLVLEKPKCGVGFAVCQKQCVFQITSFLQTRCNMLLRCKTIRNQFWVNKSGDENTSTAGITTTGVVGASTGFYARCGPLILELCQFYTGRRLLRLPSLTPSGFL